MITLRNITLRRGTHILIEQLNWTIYHKQRIGIIGANGSGKSSLFAMLLGILHPDQGDLTLPHQLKLAHVAQETPGDTRSALEFVLDGDAEFSQLQADLNDAEQQQDGERIAHLHEKLAIIDGYTAPARAAQLLAGLQFNADEQQKAVSSFSGGFRVRLNLAKALMCRSDVLLLDEPTNHLDLDAVLWLQQWLQKYPGTLILISHDRDFLDSTVDHIAHIAHQKLKLYTGNYSAFEKELAAQLLLQQAVYDKQQKKVAHLQSFINRFKAKATKARQAQSRVKALERMDLVCAVQAESPFQFEFREPKECPNPLIQLTKASLAYGEKTILSHLNLSLSPKDRIAVIGPNGAGKSSLIKLLAGELHVSGGIREVSPGLKIGYFAQHQIDHLNLSETALHHLQILSPKTPPLELRQYLGGFGFSGDRVFEPITNFSGGEKSRLALALLIWQQPNLLLLDEPTNHLDLEMRTALSIALQEYQGAMILVTHDRFLVRTTTDQLLLVADGKLENFDGDLDDYQQWLIEYRKPKSANKTEITRHTSMRERTSLRPLLDKIKKLENELAKLEKEYGAIEMILSDPLLYEIQNKEKLHKYLLEETRIKSTLTNTENAWLQASEERDAKI